MPQSLSNLLVHLVFSTKHRDPKLTREACSELYPYMTDIFKNHDCPCLQIGGIEDHVHILFNLSPTLTVAQVVEKVKTSSSKWMRAKSPDFSWQAGYGAFSVSSTNSDAVVRYIRGQAEHHRRTTFQDEYRELLKLAGVPFDERYVWD